MMSVFKLTTLSAAILAGAVLQAGPMEAKERGSARGAEMFQQLDADGDGLVTEAEIEAHRAARFASADTDGSGTLSADELSAASDGRKARRVERMIEHLDADGDGVLSESEMREGGPRGKRMAFSTLDANGDGGVSQEEFREARKSAKARWQERRNERGAQN